MTAGKENPITIRMIDHVVLRTKALAPMLAFYSEVLGCPVERRQEKFGLIQLRAGNSLIDLLDPDGELAQAFPAAPSATGPNMDHVCLQVEPWDATAIRAHLAAHGVKAPEPVSRYGAKGSGPSIYISDPDGNTVELKGPPEA